MGKQLTRMPKLKTVFCSTVPGHFPLIAERVFVETRNGNRQCEWLILNPTVLTRLGMEPALLNRRIRKNGKSHRLKRRHFQVSLIPTLHRILEEI